VHATPADFFDRCRDTHVATFLQRTLPA